MGELEPEVRPRELPEDVAELRRAAAEEHAALDGIYQPMIEAHIAAYADAVDLVIHAHRNLADRTDLNIRADTRWSAIWELSGRCLAICRVVLHDLRGGFTSEAVGTLRTLYEATILLGALAFHEEEEVLLRWLADADGVRPREARAVMERMEALARERMAEDGVEPEGRGLTEMGGEIYDLLSQPAHHRRGGFPETVSVELREFTYGPHPNAEVRAHYVSYAGELIETALIVVVDSIGGIIGREYVRDVLPRIQESLEQVRERAPLP
jgi:hypothetical protein